jgi:hypothetical protein
MNLKDLLAFLEMSKPMKLQNFICPDQQERNWSHRFVEQGEKIGTKTANSKC